VPAYLYKCSIFIHDFLYYRFFVQESCQISILSLAIFLIFNTDSYKFVGVVYNGTKILGPC
jgi:hypothetical protein